MKRIAPYISCLLLLSIYLSGKAQVRFTENKGQWDQRVLYQSDMRNTKMFISKGSMTYLFYSAEKVHDIQHRQIMDEQVNVHVVKVDFLGSNPNATYSGKDVYADYANYYHGNDPSKWKTGVKGYHKLYITDIYDRIDFELFESGGNLKYNFIVRPGGDPSLIRLKYTGADSLYLDHDNLVMKNSLGTITELRPLVFEGPESGKKIIESAYTLHDNILSFSISGKRNKNKPLIIDPILVFSTYSGSTADNFGYTATFDSLGHGYAGGTVFSFGFPVTTGAFLVSFLGGELEDEEIGYIERDCGITKYSKDGKKLIYSTYLGGSLSNENPHSMIVDHHNNLLVMGSTKSSDFPIGISPAFDFTHNGESDIFVVKFSADGTSLLGGTFVGGNSFDGLNGDRPSNQTSPLLYNYADDFRGEIIVDDQNDIFIATTTNSQDFPIISGFDNTQGGKQDGCIFQLSSDLSTLMFSSFIGGNDQDAAYGLDLGTHDDLYVTGGSNSTSFGYSVPGLEKINNGGRADGYILRIDRNSYSLLAMTFIGTKSYDQCYFIKTDKYGKPFVYGQTEGAMTASADAYSNDGGKMFIKKLEINCTAIELETTFGGPNKKRPDLSPTAFLIDECERIFISGWGGINFTREFVGGGTGGMPVTRDAFQKTTDNYDFYLAVFSKNMYELQYASFFGGVSSGSDRATTAHEHVDGGTCRFDKKGIVYHSVCAGCGGNDLFPTTPGAWSRTNNSNNCNNALFKFDFENLNRKPIAQDSLYDVFATDTLDFDIDVSDPDLSDSLRVVLTGDIFKDSSYPKPLPVIESVTKLPGRVNVLRAHVSWRPGCHHMTGDTVKLYVKVYDQGCPTQDSNQAIIRLVVKDPPLTVTPETFCLYFRDNNDIRLSWETFEKNRFFKYIVLYRLNPNKTVIALDTLFDNQPGVFTDHLTQNPKTVNFTYYMVGYNICGKPYDKGMRISTIKEFNVPIDSTYIHYATVEDNKNIRINWFTSKEEDFGSYDVFRADNINGKSTGYRKISTIEGLTDTNFVDGDVNVAEKSYCYRIGVNDQCGHVSKPSNEGCNIVLKGQVGHLFFDLDWSPYRNWKGSIKNYELQRHLDNTAMSPLVNTDLLRTHHDEDLDLWWGAYYYVVKAYESDFHGIGYGATSLSNEIRLIQPPMVFVPNAFSPNGDNVNDIWGVSHAFVREFRMQVFNRWGEKVWDNDFKGNQWDGITRGKLAMNDVFVWVVTYKGWDNRFYTQKGTVTVMP